MNTTIRTSNLRSKLLSLATAVPEHVLKTEDVLVEAMNEGAATLGTDGTILYCNARFAEMLGALRDSGTKDLCFVIGGPDGLSALEGKRAGRSLALISRMRAKARG